MTVKFRATNQGTNARQPVKALAPGVISVLGVRKISVYVEPAEMATTGWVIRPGYLYEGSRALDVDRVLYSFSDTQTITNLSGSGVLGTFQDDAGRHVEFAVPSGALKAYVRIVSAGGGTVNIQVGSTD